MKYNEILIKNLKHFKIYVMFQTISDFTKNIHDCTVNFYDNNTNNHTFTS